VVALLDQHHLADDKMKNKTPGPESFPGLPLVIGVTGHMDLLDGDGDREALEFSVRSIFLELRAAYPLTPFVLLSPLAEGADRLVARVALEKGLSLVVPLPMPQPLYERDFKTAESKAEFRKLLSQAESVLTLSPVGDYCHDEIRERNKQYAQVGAYIARHSHILLALWDEMPSEKVGGTAQIVQFRLEGVPEPYGPRHTPLDLVASGPLYHVITPRKSNSRTAGKPGELRKLYPRGYRDARAAEAAYDLIFSRTDKFNRDSRRYSSLLAASREASKKFLFSGESARLPASLKRVMDCYAAADSLATHFQSWTLGFIRMIFGLVLVGVGLLQAYSDLNWNEWSLTLYMVILFLAYILYWMAKSNEYHSKYLDYRALAEGLRVQFFWSLAGLKKPVADHYLRRQRTELDWIRKAIRVWTLSTEFQEPPNWVVSPAPAQLRVVLSEWVEGQRRFFERALERDQRWLKLQKWVARILFGASLVLSGIQIVLMQSNQLIFWMGMVLVIAGLISGYGERRALSEQIKQYSQMGTIFSLAERRLTDLLDANEHQQAIDLIEELGKEALRENGDWVLLHRERSVEVPNL
jgi:hypothetical protein